MTIGRFGFASILPRNDGKVLFEADDLEISETFETDAVGDAELRLHRGVYSRMMTEFNNCEMLPITIKTTVVLVEALNKAGGQASPAKFTSHGCETWQF